MRLAGKVLTGLGSMRKLLAAAWLASLRACAPHPARLRRRRAGWLGWLADRGMDLLGAGRVRVDL